MEIFVQNAFDSKNTNVWSKWTKVSKKLFTSNRLYFFGNQSSLVSKNIPFIIFQNVFLTFVYSPECSDNIDRIENYEPTLSIWIDIYWSFAKLKQNISKHTNRIIESFHAQQSLYQNTCTDMLGPQLSLLTGWEYSRYIEFNNTTDGSRNSIHKIESTICNRFGI